jgi:uncharacterized damage-inducible protein DinB
MKKLFLFFLLIASNLYSYSQVEISQEWTRFVQSVDASFLKKEVKFTLTASVRVVSADTTSNAWLGVWVYKKDGSRGFFKNTSDHPIRSNKWTDYTIEGKADENSDQIKFGGGCFGNGQFFFDHFKLHVENEKGVLQEAIIENPSFENIGSDNMPTGWTSGVTDNTAIRIKGFSFSVSKDAHHGNLALLVEGRGIEKGKGSIIEPVKGYSPQIGTLVSMLNNLSDRVEQVVYSLNQDELDHLLDNKANSIGALIMHLAAAEAFYQVFTFENREFNEEEKKKWSAALDLDEEGRLQLKGHTVDYYLNEFRAVRKKTIEELAKRNDEWLAQSVWRPEWNMNNHFAWFHVMEHQSSHLGQVLMLKKRLPKRKKKEQLKVQLQH